MHFCSPVANRLLFYRSAPFLEFRLDRGGKWQRAPPQLCCKLVLGLPRYLITANSPHQPMDKTPTPRAAPCRKNTRRKEKKRKSVIIPLTLDRFNNDLIWLDVTQIGNFLKHIPQVSTSYRSLFPRRSNGHVLVIFIALDTTVQLGRPCCRITREQLIRSSFYNGKSDRSPVLTCYPGLTDSVMTWRWIVISEPSLIPSCKVAWVGPSSAMTLNPSSTHFRIVQQYAYAHSSSF